MAEESTDRKSQKIGFSGYDIPLDISDDDAEITHVDRGTPCGEYLRRFWQPVMLSSELEDLPKTVTLLGEDLVLFRDKSGDLGLFHKHCIHRGASLEYGIIAEHGLICCYHGWHYNIDGTLIRAGSEPEKSPLHRRVVQGAYPTHEFEGVIFAYMGPTGDIPPFPQFDTLLEDRVEKIPFSITTHCNWLQVYENTQDPIHVLHLHARSSGVQFGAASGIDQIIDYRDTPLGMINVQTREVGKHIWIRCTETILPNMNQGGAIWEEAESEKVFNRSAFTRWMVPQDNFVTRTIGWRLFSHDLDPSDQGDRSKVGVESIDFIGQTKDERNYEESQRFPGDYEAQVSQRPIAIHNLENLASSDRGVARLRQMIRTRIRNLKEGTEPVQPAPNSLGLVPTFVQDSVVKAKLNNEQKRKFSHELVDYLLDNTDQNETDRREGLKQFCNDWPKA